MMTIDTVHGRVGRSLLVRLRLNHTVLSSMGGARMYCCHHEPRQQAYACTIHVR